MAEQITQEIINDAIEVEELLSMAQDAQREAEDFLNTGRVGSPTQSDVDYEMEYDLSNPVGAPAVDISTQIRQGEELMLKLDDVPKDHIAKTAKSIVNWSKLVQRSLEAEKGITRDFTNLNARNRAANRRADLIDELKLTLDRKLMSALTPADRIPRKQPSSYVTAVPTRFQNWRSNYDLNQRPIPEPLPDEFAHGSITVPDDTFVRNSAFETHRAYRQSLMDQGRITSSNFQGFRPLQFDVTRDDRNDPDDLARTQTSESIQQVLLRGVQPGANVRSVGVKGTRSIVPLSRPFGPQRYEIRDVRRSERLAKRQQ